jgi:D-alanyl-lipoteichoic acid acyltransferase DltB (MBOAT superfamily)
MLLVASYIFYGAWDWRFLSLIFISTVLDYVCGLKIYKSKDVKQKKLFLFFSVAGNLSILGFFKYFDFFASGLQSLLSYFGITIQPHFLQLILPVGISFYTFQTMSYTIDIYRNQMEPTKRFFDLALFVAFFPQLIAGPIERARHLLPQILSPRKLTLDKFYGGCYLIFWGLFMKIFIADNMAKIVDPVFAASPPYSGAMVIIALYAFAFQIFCDFAGYSNIARGLGKCMGFDIMVNFNLPYFATNPRQFWKRWHISLSSWLRDYLYIPLGGNRKGTIITYRNIAIIMLLGGLWHGAAWTFVLWGAYQAILLILYRFLSPWLEKIPTPQNIFCKKIWFVMRVLFFFQLICIGWLLFRAQSMAQAFNMFRAIVFNLSLDPQAIKYYILYILFIVWFLLLVQITQWKKNKIPVVREWPIQVKFYMYLLMFYLMVIWGHYGAKEFIYFQF